jgi:hypothetical protein
MMAAAKVTVTKAVTAEMAAAMMPATMTTPVAAAVTTTMTAAAMTAAAMTAAASTFRQRRTRQHDCQRNEGNYNDQSLHRTLPAQTAPSRHRNLTEWEPAWPRKVPRAGRGIRRLIAKDALANPTASQAGVIPSS